MKPLIGYKALSVAAWYRTRSVDGLQVKSVCSKHFVKSQFTRLKNPTFLYVFRSAAVEHSAGLSLAGVGHRELQPRRHRFVEILLHRIRTDRPRTREVPTEGATVCWRHLVGTSRNTSERYLLEPYIQFPLWVYTLEDFALCKKISTLRPTYMQSVDTRIRTCTHKVIHNSARLHI